MKTVKVSELKNLHKIIAEEILKHRKEYICLIDGERVKVVK